MKNSGNKLLLVGLLIAIFSYSNAQQLPLYSQYLMNGFLLNPAMAGSENYIPLRLTARQQWTGINDAPSTQALSAHGSLGRQKIMGVGGYIYNDMYGPFSMVGAQVAYSYKLKLNSTGTKLGLGLSASVSQFSFSEGNLDPIYFDEDITGAKESNVLPDVGFGAYLYDVRYYVGISVNNLIQYKLDLGIKDSKDTKLVRHYFAVCGYKYSLSNYFTLEPSLLFKATERTPMNIDINAKVIYKESYYLGFSYRSDKTLVTILGVKYNNYYLGYAFDYPFTTLNNYTNGSHEIVLGMNFAIAKGSSLL